MSPVIYAEHTDNSVDTVAREQHFESVLMVGLPIVSSPRASVSNHAHKDHRRQSCKPLQRDGAAVENDFRPSQQACTKCSLNRSIEFLLCDFFAPINPLVHELLRTFSLTFFCRRAGSTKAIFDELGATAAASIWITLIALATDS
jgi:hypothetical protein